MATEFDLKGHHKKRIGGLWRTAPFVLRITEWKDLPVPVLVVKERQEPRRPDRQKDSPEGATQKSQGSLMERGHIAGSSLRRILPVLRRLLERVCDDMGVPLELQRYLTQDGLKVRDNLPLDAEAGAKLSLIFRLQERVNDLDRVELIARRIARFTREEAAYWLSRMTSFGPDANRWAISGLRTMLGGTPKDRKAVERMLERLRTMP